MSQQTPAITRSLPNGDVISTEFYIAGARFRWTSVTEARAEGMTAGSIINLVGEPSNPHDSNAVKVMFGSYHIGYVPRYISPVFWERHKAGFQTVSKIVAVNNNAEPHEMFKVETTFTKV